MIDRYTVIDGDGPVQTFFDYDGQARRRANEKLASFSVFYTDDEIQPYVDYKSVDTISQALVKIWQKHCYHVEFSRRGGKGHKTVKRNVQNVRLESKTWHGEIVFDGQKMPVIYKDFWGWETRGIF